MTSDISPSSTRCASNGKSHHHWVIDSPQGATSSGRCKRCGERKDFYNALEGVLIDKAAPAPTAS